MTIDFEALKSKLRPPVSREIIVEIISHGLNTPALLKAAAYMLINRMDQPSLDNLGGIAIEAIEYFERSDLEGLKAFLTKHKIPPQLIGTIIDYAANLAKIQ
jgi:hypothetical protein